MQCCQIKVSASQFILYTTIANPVLIAAASLPGPTQVYFSWPITMFTFAVLIALAWLLLQFLTIDKQAEEVLL